MSSPGILSTCMKGTAKQVAVSCVEDGGSAENEAFGTLNEGRISSQGPIRSRRQHNDAMLFNIVREGFEVVKRLRPLQMEY